MSGSTTSTESTPGSDGPEAIAGRLGEREGAWFVADLRATLDMNDEEFELALARLLAEGRIVVQHNFCADPHFIDDDLRVLALVDRDKSDPRASAAASCEHLWQRWMANFLASHRCT